MTVTYSPAPDVWEIVQQIIADRRDDLATCRIECIYRSEAAKSHGRVVLGRARKISGLNAFLAQADGYNPTESAFYVIEIAEDRWLDLTEAQRVALVDHELMHLAPDENDDGELVLGMRGHDLEEFVEIVERHGLWKPDVTVFAGAVATQLSLEIPDHYDDGDES